MKAFKLYNNSLSVLLLLVLSVYESPFNFLYHKFPFTFNLGVFVLLVVLAALAPFINYGKGKEAYDYFEKK